LQGARILYTGPRLPVRRNATMDMPQTARDWPSRRPLVTVPSSTRPGLFTKSVDNSVENDLIVVRRKPAAGLPPNWSKKRQNLLNVSYIKTLQCFSRPHGRTIRQAPA
jgi:hypothetical protein